MEGRPAASVYTLSGTMAAEFVLMVLEAIWSRFAKTHPNLIWNSNNSLRVGIARDVIETFVRSWSGIFMKLHIWAIWFNHPMSFCMSFSFAMEFEYLSIPTRVFMSFEAGIYQERSVLSKKIPGTFPLFWFLIAFSFLGLFSASSTSAKLARFLKSRKLLTPIRPCWGLQAGHRQLDKEPTLQESYSLQESALSGFPLLCQSCGPNCLRQKQD